MYELAHNCCCYENGNAVYRDFEMEMDAREFARNLMVTLTDDELSLDDDEFDEEVLENLQYDQFSDVRGLIALFYRNLWAMADLRERLKEYEDAEEQGLLIRLPVAEGTLVFCIGSCGEICDDYEKDCRVCGQHEVVYCMNFDRNLVEHFGKTVFLSEAEAEQALAAVQKNRKK